MLGDVGKPQPVRTGCGEVTADQVGSAAGRGLSVAGASAGKRIHPLVKELAGDGAPVTVTCRVLKLGRQPYYRWLDQPDASTSTTSSDGLRSRWPPARPSHPARDSSQPARRPGGTLPDKAWAQRHPSHPPHRASQFRCHPIVRQTLLWRADRRGRRLRRFARPQVRGSAIDAAFNTRRAMRAVQSAPPPDKRPGPICSSSATERARM